MTRILTFATQLLIASGPAAAQPPQPGPNSDAKVAALLAAWEKTRNELPVLRYTYTQKQYWPPEFSDSPTGTTSTEDRELTVDWKTGRYRLVRVSPAETGGEYVRTTSVFNGKSIRSISEQLLATRVAKPGAEIEAGVMEGHLSSLGANESTYQLPHVSVGHLPNLAGSNLTEQLTPTVPSGLLYFARNARHSNTSLDIYSSYPAGAKSAEMVSEVYTDTAHDFCVIKFVTYNGKEPYQVYNIKWGLQDGLWSPTEWSLEAYTSGKRLVSTLSARAIRVQPVLDSDNAFTLRFADGLKVTRKVVPNTKGGRAHPTSQPAVAQGDEVVEIGGQGGTWWKSLWFWGVVACATLACVVLVRIRHRRRTTFKRGVA